MAGADRNRASRVAEAIKIELADLVAREVKDPRVRAGLVTVSHVEVNRDLSVAEVGVSILAGQPDAVMKGLQKAAAFLRGPLARRLRLRIAPDLRFHHDKSQAMASRLRDIVRDDEVRRVESGRDDDEDLPGPADDGVIEVTSAIDEVGGVDEIEGADEVAGIGDVEGAVEHEVDDEDAMGGDDQGDRPDDLERRRRE
ncbi:MAG TPA: 30S ribosome-binding factor RbfA [Kofleriaceae bacterium]|nr:30S ribosome-binding factor RbfA [Kofleriaceae bacterium]